MKAKAHMLKGQPALHFSDTNSQLRRICAEQKRIMSDRLCRFSHRPMQPWPSLESLAGIRIAKVSVAAKTKAAHKKEITSE
jgi:hypothetical protein